MLSSKTKDTAVDKTLNAPRWQQVLAREGILKQMVSSVTQSKPRVFIAVHRVALARPALKMLSST